MPKGINRPPLIQFHPFRINIGTESSAPPQAEPRVSQPIEVVTETPVVVPEPPQPPTAYDVHDGQPKGHTILRKDS